MGYMNVYADNAATTKMDNEAAEQMIYVMKHCAGNPSSLHSEGRNARLVVEDARKTIANIVNCDSSEIYFTSGGCESNSWVINSFSGAGKKIITTETEHHSIINVCRNAQKRGTKVDYLPVNTVGAADCRMLQNYDRSNLVSVMSANNEIGTIQDIRGFAKEAHARGAYFHTDAVQAVGHIEINVRDMDIDLMSASAHKFNGPKGTGFLYIKEDVPVSTLIYGGTQERGFRGGTENTAAIAGMAVALKNNIVNMAQNKKYICRLENYIREFLDSRIPDARFNGDIENHIPGNISVSFRGINGEALLHLLDLKGICVSTGSACNEGEDKVSYVLEAVGVSADYIKGTIRISIDKYNTMEEMVYMCTKLKEVYNILKNR